MSNSETVHPQLVDRKGRLWQERTVIVRRESDGFGFTLSQQMPVFVDKVFPGSSAEKARVIVGDRILKVNGVSVVGHKHTDVVEMIRDSSFVTLTLIGKLGPNGTAKVQRSDSSHNLEISAPRQLQELTLQSLKMMLQRQRKSYEMLSVEYGKQPSEKLEKELKDCESIIKILESEIASKSPAIQAHRQTTSASIEALTGRCHHRLPIMDERTLTKRLLGGSYREGEDGEHQQTSSGSSTPGRKVTSSTLGSNSARTIGNSGSSGGDLSPKPSRSHTFSFSNGSLSPLKQWKFGRRQVGDVSDGSDDDLSDEVDGASEAGPFSSLQELKGAPAHMSVFLHYLYVSKDPKYLLFYLVANSYQSQCKGVELLKQRGRDICWTFISDHAPLHLKLEESVKQRILNTLENEESESKLKSVFVEVRESLSQMIITDLANYRHKRIMGLAGMFGDHLLSNQMTFTKQCDVMISTLSQDLKQCLDEKSTNSIEEAIKNQAIAACLATFMQDVLNTGSRTSVKPPSILEKVQSFTNQQKKAKNRRRPSAITKNGHTFQLTAYKNRTICNLCGKMLWGVVYHGYQCTLCEINIHRYHCIGEVTAECAGQGRRTIKLRKSSQHKNVNLAVTPEEKDGIDSCPIPRREDEEEQVASADPISPSVPEPDPEPAQGSATSGPRRSRAITDPKAHLILGASASVSIGGEERNASNDQPPRKENLSRTQSERLQSKPDSVQKQLNSEQSNHTATLAWPTNSNSVHSSTSFSDESQLSGLAKGSIDESSGTSLPVVETSIKELEDDEIESERIPWALKAKRILLQGMKRYEIERQENIRELVYTERTHLQKLKIMKYMYKIPLQKQNILSPHQAEQLFPSLEELILFHSGLCADLKERVGPVQNEICKNIADVLLQRFDGAAGERLCHACSVFAANQAKGDKLLKEWRRKNDRFRTFIKAVGNDPFCQRLSLTELMPIAWQRLTKYKLLINNILKSYKRDWDALDEEDKKEGTMIETAHICVKNILQYVNKQVRRAENKQRLSDVQAKMDLSAMEKAQHPIAQLFKNLDLTAENRRLVHEGPLTFRIQHRKPVELYALLLNDVLVLLERHDEKFYLRCHTAETVSGNKEEYSPVIRLQECLLRHAAHDRGNRTFLVVNNSDLMKLAQMYEFIAEGPQEKKHWEEAIKRAMIGQEDLLSPELPSSPVGNEFSGGRLPLGLSSLTSHLNPREQLNKIDDDMKKLLMDKLSILRAMQGGVGGHRSTDSTPKHVPAKKLDTPKAIVETAIEQAGEISSTVAHIMVPNPTKSIIAETQSRLTDIIRELEKNLSRLIMLVGDKDLNTSIESFPSLDLDMVTGEHDSSDKASSSTPTGDETHEFGSLTPVQREFDEVVGGSETAEMESTGGREASGSEDMINIPSPIPEVDELMQNDSNDKIFVEGDALELPPARSQTSLDEALSSSEELTVVVAPPDHFLGDDSATPTPMQDYESLDSGKSTPRFLESPSLDVLTGKSSPLVVAQYRSSDDQAHRTDQKAPDSSSRIEPESSRPSLSPLAKTVYSSSQSAEQSTTEVNKPGSQSPKGLSIFPSSQHDCQPTEHSSTDEEDVASYTLLRESATTSSESEVSLTTGLAAKHERHPDDHEGTDL